MDISLSRRQMFVMFGAIYFVQGVIQAYQLNFFKPHMNAAGIDADRLAIVSSLALLPFIIKWVFGLISDKFPLWGRGHRVPYMLIGLIGTAVAFAVAYFIDPARSFGVLAAMVVSATFFMALFDTTADALSIDAVDPVDHPVVQAWMNGGRAVGLVALSLAFGLVAEVFGYQLIFLVIAALMLIPLRYVSRVREPARHTDAHAFDRRAFRVMVRPRYLLFGLGLILAWTFFQGIDGIVTFYMSDELGASGSTIGLYGTLKGVGMLVGGVGLSRLVRLRGRRVSTVTTVALITVGGLLFSVMENETSLLVAAPLWGIAVGFQWTNYVTFAMGITDLRIAGSMFAILQTMSNIGLAAGEGIATALTDNIGYSGVFRWFGLANIAVIPLMFVVIARFGDRVERTPVLDTA
ncbi:MAG: MFS transporter [Acidimicrobiia bacterium]|nr:MFS transporter [Acidimicrobiia bacterium]